jgi:L-methionine (R)-S-oxide reductase
METQDKQSIYDIIINKLNNFYKKYDKDPKLSSIARMASLSSILRLHFEDLKFVGFYIVKSNSGESYLEIGPYVSDILATPKIGFGKGVCGTCWKEKETVIINNVSKCNNYIACDEETQSEIVIPIIVNGEVLSVWDIDSVKLDRFDDIDRINLEYLIKNFL